MLISDLDERTVAIVFEVNRSARVLTGKARYRPNERNTTGPFLSVIVDDEMGQEGRPELIIPEVSWSGRIERDEHHGCDYCMRLNLPQAKKAT